MKGLIVPIRLCILSTDKYKLKVKYDKIWRYHNEGVPLKRGRQNSILLPLTLEA